MSSIGEFTGFVVLIMIFSAATMRWVYKDEFTKVTDDKFVDDLKPKLWWVVDDGEPNSRYWLDWGARLMKSPNSPFLNVHLKRCRQLNEKEFHIAPLIGRGAVHAVLSEKGVEVPAEAMIAPGWLWRAWASSQMMAYVGGLWMDSYVLCIKPITPVLGEAKALRFGTDPEENLVGAGGKVGHADNVFFALEEGSGLWLHYAQDLNKLMKGGPLSWNAAKIRRAIRYLQDKHLSDTVPVVRSAEWSRFKSGKKIETEDLLDRFIEGINEMPPKEVVYVPLANDNLNRSVVNGWFLRLSENQLLEAKFLWAHLATPVG